jgi:phosphatidylglycerophosphate synthase
MDLLLGAPEAAIWGAGLAVAGAVLVVWLWRSAQPPGHVPDLDEFFARWREAHDGYDPRHGSVWVRGWLITVYRFARPLARAGVSADLLTLGTVWVAVAVVVTAAAGGTWPVLAGWLVIFAGLVDSLDGAVAVLTRRATSWGYVLDSAVDRGNDVLFAWALVVVGAPLWLALVYVALFFELEYIRARAGNAGGDPIGAVTVGERANRVAFSGTGLFVAGLVPLHAGRIATAVLGILVALSAAGLWQLVVAVRRDLAPRAMSRGTDQVGDDGRREGDQRHPAAGM